MDQTVSKIVLGLIGLAGITLKLVGPKLTKRWAKTLFISSAAFIVIACVWDIYDYRHPQPPPVVAAPLPTWIFPHPRVTITDSKIGRANSIADVPQGSNVEINVIRTPIENVGEVLHESPNAKDPSAK
jgi:hypothetical protein